jgi:hypothetical protein
LRFRCRHSLFGHPVPAGELSSPHGRPTARPEGRADPDGVSTFRTFKQRPGWVPSISQGRRCSPGLATITSPRLPHHSDPSLRPATTTHLSETPLHETSTKGSRMFTRPVFPSPVAPGWNGSSWALPPSFAPRDYSQRTSGRGQAIEHGPETCVYGISRTSNLAGLLDTCDLVALVEAEATIAACERVRRGSDRRPRSTSGPLHARDQSHYRRLVLLLVASPGAAS